MSAQAVKEQLKGYEKGFAEGGKTKNVEKEMAYVQAQLKGYSEVCAAPKLTFRSLSKTASPPFTPPLLLVLPYLLRLLNV